MSLHFRPNHRSLRPSVEAHIDQLQLTERSSRSVRFLILRQKFYELLESRGAAEAMVCLREEIAPLEVTEGARLAHDVDNCSSIQPTNGIHHQPSTQHSRTVELGSARLGRNLHELRYYAPISTRDLAHKPLVPPHSMLDTWF